MVGADELLLQMKDKLTSDRLNLQIIPIVGMGGTGKTTLARNIYQDRLIVEHFHIRAWATVSQEYSIREILVQLLSKLNEKVDQRASVGELGDSLYKHLFGRKYLIILDDMWNIEAWEGVKMFLPNSTNGSRIVVTTRLSNLASKLPNSNSLLRMSLLDEADSWELLSKTVFGKESYPLELEEIGKKIGKSCKGLPLSIVVVGGFLVKSEHTSEFWGYVEKNLNSIVTLMDDERCLRIIHMSYKQLPIHLKSSFLYMGVFPEDRAICVSQLIKLWVSEGFLKPISGKSLEEIAKEYLKDLIDRNLIQVLELGSTGNIKYCKIHDLLREFCSIQAQKERFYNVVRPNTPRGITDSTQGRLVISRCTSKQETADALQSWSLARSMIWDLEEEPQTLENSRLLRVFHSGEATHSPEDMLQLVNSRYLSITTQTMSRYLPPSTCRFWNLQTLIIKSICRFTGPHEIWYMTQIRHIKFDNISLPNPPSGQDGVVVLGNLQTLSKINDFNFSEEAVKRIPNLKKLKASYKQRQGTATDSLRNLACLHKLESLEFRMEKMIRVKRDCLQSLSLPQSLKKLSLSYCFFENWQVIWEMIGKLLLLEKLQFLVGRCGERELETVEGMFPRLKLLAMEHYYHLETWTMESSHFPCLEHLVLTDVKELKEIPLELEEIATLKLIELKHCSKSVVISAISLVEEQEQLHGEVALRIRVVTMNRGLRDELEGLANPNLQVICLR